MGSAACASRHWVLLEALLDVVRPHRHRAFHGRVGAVTAHRSSNGRAAMHKHWLGGKPVQPPNHFSVSESKQAEL